MTVLGSRNEDEAGALHGETVELVAANVQQAGRDLLDLILPPQCACCDAPVESQGQICGACFARLSFITEPMCRRCGVPFAAVAQGGPDQICQACRQMAPVFDAARAALRYDDHARPLILPLKHADRVHLAMVLAPHMARAGVELLQRCDILVPVPLHRRRLFKRRYNQAALLARAIGRITSRPVLVDGMARIRATEALGNLPGTERSLAVADAFAIRPRHRMRIASRRVLLIDDVMTSGATANGCAKALLEAGADGVDVLLAARVPDPRLIPG